MDCRLTIAQINPTLGNVGANLAQHVTAIEAALAAGSQLIVFPELSLTGYFLKDQTAELARPVDAPELRKLCTLSKRISIAVGFVELAADGRIYNSVAFLEDGKVLHVHRKVHLVTYGLFDEGRDFAAGERFRTITSRHGRFGPMICEDMWHMPSAYSYFLDDADAILVASASPARGVDAPGPGLASQRTWNVLLSATALLYRTWVVYSSRVGWEDGIGFGGGSRVLDPYANARAALEGLEPGALTATMDSAILRRARNELPLRRDEKPWILATELARHVPLLGALRGEAALKNE